VVLGADLSTERSVEYASRSKTILFIFTQRVVYAVISIFLSIVVYWPLTQCIYNVIGVIPCCCNHGKVNELFESLRGNKSSEDIVHIIKALNMIVRG
jgi:hypothetical protein